MHDANIEGFQLSPQQRRLWTLTQEQGGESPYWARCVVRIHGPVDLAALMAVLKNLSGRHEIMRTTFYTPEEVSTPFQVIAPMETATAKAMHEDLRHMDTERQRYALDALNERIRRSLAADATSLPIVGVASLSTTDHRLVIGMPGLRCDLRGLKSLVADIASAYEARVRRTALPDEGLQYVDVSAWLNEALESPDTAVGRRFWESQDFSRFLACRLPFERDTDGCDFSPRRAPIRLPRESVAAARRLAAARSTSLEMVLLTCWQCVLQRTIGSDRVVVGYLSDGRSYAELERAIGLFARSLPLPGDLRLDVTFVDAMQRVADAVRQATQWGECFDWRLMLRDHTDRTPYAPLTFERQDAKYQHVVENVVFEIVEAEACVEPFKLKLCCPGDGGESWNTWLEYDAASYRDEDVAQLAARLETIFAAAADNPATAVGTLRLLPAVQEHEIVAASGRADVVPSERLVHELFEAQALRAPGATAVVYEDTELTYGQLNALANQVAHRLKADGVGPDVPVGLCIERGPDVAVGILGILKAGGAYVPLDPQLPAARLAVMLETSGAAIVVSRTGLRSQLPPAARTLLLDGDQTIIDASPTTNPVSAAGPDNLAYVLFTSGSTGTPKGVAIEHRQLASYVDAVSAQLEVPPGAAFATVTTFAADLGNTAIYPALTSGGRLHIVSAARAADPQAFSDYIERHPIDVLKIVPSHLKALLSCSRPARVLPRQRLVLGGEACSWELVDEVQRLAPACVVFNHYGPTEATVGATVYRVPTNGSRPPSATVPIGRPLGHARAYVLDEYQQIVPLWVAGQLYIGGAGVARGYLADTELTNERFVADPWSLDTGGRMYKTGDRVRLLPGGWLEFLGRVDNQVKIRGFRVEPGEVEAALRRHPDVKDVSVLAHEDDAGTRLAAFLVYRNSRHADSSELRAFLAQHGLPDFMIPGSFVPLDALPLTLNGKLDRRALIPLLALPAARHEVDERLSEWESMIAGVWQEFLGVEQVQARDNFYDLGGHSLMAIQVVTALERRARVQISPRDLVFHTLKQFAALCASKNALSVDARHSRA